jgi:predicted SnoaL-like aldol condensation-catalyzing enzyme
LIFPASPNVELKINPYRENITAIKRLRSVALDQNLSGNRAAENEKFNIDSRLIMIMNKKDIAIDLLKLASSGKVREAYDKYVHPDFRHHNAYFKGDRDSLLRGMEQAALTSPNKFLEVQCILEDGNMVAVHSHVKKENETDIAVVHIFRFEDC